MVTAALALLRPDMSCKRLPAGLRGSGGRVLRVPVDNRSIALRVRAVGGPQARYGLGVGFGVDAVVLAAVL